MPLPEVGKKLLSHLAGRPAPPGRSFVDHLLSLASALAGTADPETRHAQICEHVRALLDCDRSSIFLADGDHFLAHANAGNPDWIRDRFAGHRVSLGDPLIREVIERREQVVVNDAVNDPRMNRETALSAGIHAMVVAPIFDHEDRTLGFITAEFNERKLDFRPEEAELFGALAKLVAQSVEREEQVRQHRRMQRQLAKADELAALGRFADGLAHDFNNRLTAIVAISDLLIEESRGTETEILLEELVRSVEGAAELTQHLLEVARGDRQKAVVSDVAEGFRTLGAFLRPLVRSDIELEIVSSIEGAACAAVSELGLRRILSNLVLNAATASAPGGQIRIRLRRRPQRGDDTDTGNVETAGDVRGEDLEIVVEDDGAGIAPDELERIFDPFYTSHPEGMGLGLSVVSSIAGASGGRVEVESTLGKGTRMVVTLPERPAPKRAQTEALHISSPSQTSGLVQPTVLLVDDDEPIRRILRQALRKRGIRILEAVNGRDALAVSEREQAPIDVVVTDVVMPQMDGIDLALALLERPSPPRIVFTSAYGPGLRDRLGDRLYDFEFVPKPFTPKQILDKIELAIARSSALH